MTVKIGLEHLSLLKKLHAVINTETNPVKQQVAIELLMASHAMRFAGKYDFVLDAMRKHAGQMVTTAPKSEAETAGPDGYKYYSQTTSGWTISTNPKAEPAKRWRAEHPEFGTRYFKEHDEILEYTVTNMMKTFEQVLGFKMPKDRK